MSKNIATSTSGLISRMNSNSKNEFKNYDEWIKELLISHISPPKECLDIGCGVGKQTILIHNLYPFSNITSVDKSQKSLDTIYDLVPSSRINLICSDIDDFQNYCTKKYDLIISSYAFYYSKNMVDLLIKYSESLKKDGMILLLGYSKRSNLEIINVINQSNTKKISFYKDFLSLEELDLLKEHFLIDVSYFDNKIGFNSLSDFQQWFETSELLSKSENLDQLLREISNFIQKNGAFLVTKETLSIVLKKKPVVMT